VCERASALLKNDQYSRRGSWSGFKQIVQRGYFRRDQSSVDPNDSWIHCIPESVRNDAPPKGFSEKQHRSITTSAAIYGNAYSSFRALMVRNAARNKSRGVASRCIIYRDASLFDRMGCFGHYARLCGQAWERRPPLLRASPTRGCSVSAARTSELSTETNFPHKSGANSMHVM